MVKRDAGGEGILDATLSALDHLRHAYDLALEQKETNAAADLIIAIKVLSAIIDDIRVESESRASSSSLCRLEFGVQN